MLTKIYKKNEVTFAIILIVIYVVGTSIAESISETIGVMKLIPAIFHILFATSLLIWIRRNDFYDKYGLCLPKYKAAKAWFYIPLIAVAGWGLVFGINVRYSFLETTLYVISMLCVGFLEEIIFRGFLFKGMAANNLRAAIIVSSITFGIGHIVNLLNGRQIAETSLQIVFAIAVGFTLVILFYKGKSLIPCVVFHGINNALSAFELTNEEVANKLSISEIKFEVIVIAICVLGLTIYGVHIAKKLNIGG